MNDIKKFNFFLNENIEDKKQKSLYKTVVEVVILSEEPLDEENISLSQIEYLIKEGECSGIFSIKSQDVLLGEEAIKAAKIQGVEPSFFKMDDKGNEIVNEPDDIDSQTI
jgi:tartrate dehydratase beta subunit/fumarate hydratase class I family protein